MQLHITFKTSRSYDKGSARLRIEACIRDNELWMLLNKLKMNSGKADVAVFSSRYCPKPSLHSVSVCDKTIQCASTKDNIGVLFDYSRSFLSTSSYCDL